MKTIIVQWTTCNDGVYNSEMIVVVSAHEKYVAGSRFDFGFFSIATNEGYTIVSLPIIKSHG